MGETTYYQRSREVILNRAKEYYENNKKIKKREYAKNRYKNLSEEKKQNFKEYQNKYQKNYREAKEQNSI